MKTGIIAAGKLQCRLQCHWMFLFMMSFTCLPAKLMSVISFFSYFLFIITQNCVYRANKLLSLAVSCLSVCAATQREWITRKIDLKKNEEWMGETVKKKSAMTMKMDWKNNNELLNVQDFFVMIFRCIDEFYARLNFFCEFVD